MNKTERQCIKELYLFIEEITDKSKKRDLSLFRVASIGGCDQYQGLPPICRKRDALLNKYEDIIHDALNK
jgi:hypothetical protein